VLTVHDDHPRAEHARPHAFRDPRAELGVLQFLGLLFARRRLVAPRLAGDLVVGRRVVVWVVAHGGEKSSSRLGTMVCVEGVTPPQRL
jgi:hypothetical protein